MIVGSELEDWLADRARQRRDPERRSTASPTRWHGGDVHRRFDRSDGRACQREDAEASPRPPAPCSPTIAGSTRLIDGLAEQMRADPFFDPPFRPINSDIHTGLLVFEDEHVSIARRASARAAQLAAKKSGASAARPRSAFPASSACSNSSRRAAPASRSGKRRRSPRISPPPTAGRCRAPARASSPTATSSSSTAATSAM